MRTPDVVIVYRHPLFAQGIESLLRAEGVGGVVRVPAGEPSVAEEIRNLDPCVVVLEDQQPDAQRLLPPILDAIPWVVRVGLDGSAAEIYRRSSLIAENGLVRLIARLTRRGGRAQEPKTS